MKEIKGLRKIIATSLVGALAGCSHLYITPPSPDVFEHRPGIIIDEKVISEKMKSSPNIERGKFIHASFDVSGISACEVFMERSRSEPPHPYFIFDRYNVTSSRLGVEDNVIPEVSRQEALGEYFGDKLGLRACLLNSRKECLFQKKFFPDPYINGRCRVNLYFPYDKDATSLAVYHLDELLLLKSLEKEENGEKR